MKSYYVLACNCLSKEGVCIFCAKSPRKCIFQKSHDQSGIVRKGALVVFQTRQERALVGERWCAVRGRGWETLLTASTSTSAAAALRIRLALASTATARGTRLAAASLASTAATRGTRLAAASPAATAATRARDAHLSFASATPTRIGARLPVLVASATPRSPTPP